MLRELLIIRGPVAVPVRANHQVIGLTFEPFGSKLQDVRLIGGEKRRRCAWAATPQDLEPRLLFVGAERHAKEVALERAHANIPRQRTLLLKLSAPSKRGLTWSPEYARQRSIGGLLLNRGEEHLDVVVDDTSARASLKGGTATILPEGATTWRLLDGDAAREVVKGTPHGKAATAAAAERCAKASAASKSLEDALVLPDAATSPTFGDLSMRANDAHVLARALCAIAKLRDDPASNSLTRWSPPR